jgi:hypothetical protein
MEARNGRTCTAEASQPALHTELTVTNTARDEKWEYAHRLGAIPQALQQAVHELSRQSWSDY